MFRYRMNSRSPRTGWLLLAVIVVVFLLIVTNQPKSTQTSTAANPSTTQSGSTVASTLLQAWQDIRLGAEVLWSRLTSGAPAEPVNINLDTTLDSNGSGEDDDPAADADVTVQVTNKQTPEAFIPAGSSPQILIYHTHSYEAYDKQDGQDYVETAQWRTANNEYNIARVGEELAKTLSSKYGIAVLHDSTDNEYPKLGTAYARSLKTVQKDLAQYPSLKILIDLHRDAFNAGIDPSTVTINGKDAARVMIVIGTGEGQTGVGFTQKPNWQKNLVLAKAITDKLNDFNPLLARKVDIKTGRYNQHVSTGAVLIEVGHNKNTLDEALATVPYLAQAIADAYASMADSITTPQSVAPSSSATPSSPIATSPSASLSPSVTPSPAQSTPALMPSPTISGPLQQVQKIIDLETVSTAPPSVK